MILELFFHSIGERQKNRGTQQQQEVVQDESERTPDPQKIPGCPRRVEQLTLTLTHYITTIDNKSID